MNAVMYVPTAHGGHARYASELLTAMSRRLSGGEQVSLVTSRDLAPEFESPEYPIHRVLPPLDRKTFATRVQWGASRLLHYYRRDSAFVEWVLCRPDVEVVHLQEYCPLFAPRHFAALKRHGKRLFYTVHNVRPHVRRGAAIDAAERLRRRAWRACDGLFVHSRGLKQQLEASLGAGHPPVHVVPHGVWTVPSPVQRMGDSASRAAQRRLLAFGVLRRNKGIHVLLDALRDLPEFTACIAGSPVDARYADELTAQARALPEGQVMFISRVMTAEELPALFNSCSAVVLPYTEFSAQSGVLHDALAFGLPVVATAVGALGESVMDMGIGEVARPGNAADLRAALVRLHAPSRYEQAIEAIARERERHSWSAAAKDTWNAYLG